MNRESETLFLGLEGISDSQRFPLIPRMIPTDSRKLSSPFPVPPPIGGNRESGRRLLTEHFRPNTCPRCHRITVAGIWLGFRVDLEPTVLDDLGEYQALVDEVTTWNLWPDMIARPRTVASILHPNVTDRHAEHSCAATYGTLHPTPRPHPIAAPVSDAPPF